MTGSRKVLRWSEGRGLESVHKLIVRVCAGGDGLRGSPKIVIREKVAEGSTGTRHTKREKERMDLTKKTGATGNKNAVIKSAGDAEKKKDPSLQTVTVQSVK